MKVGAIEERAKFMVPRLPGEEGVLVGLEPSSDLAGSLSLDDALSELDIHHEAPDFYSRMIAAHLAASFPGVVAESSRPTQLVERAFEPGAFAELLIAGEGIPRDTLQLLGAAAAKAGTGRIAPRHVRAAAVKFFERDKLKGIEGSGPAQDLWGKLVTTVLQKGQSRFAFSKTLWSEFTGPMIELYDNRIVHRVSTTHWDHRWPTEALVVYRIDYGATVHYAAQQALLANRDTPSSHGEYLRPLEPNRATHQITRLW